MSIIASTFSGSNYNFGIGYEAAMEAILKRVDEINRGVYKPIES